jgi:hypothetical protein
VNVAVMDQPGLLCGIRAAATGESGHARISPSMIFRGRVVTRYQNASLSGRLLEVIGIGKTSWKR